MFFVEIDDDGISLKDIKRISQHIANNYDNLVEQLTESELVDLSFMLKPTLHKDHDEDEIRERWAKFLKEFTLKEDDGKAMNFFYAENGHLYFGDKEGMKMANNLNNGNDYPKNAFNNLD